MIKTSLRRTIGAAVLSSVLLLPTVRAQTLPHGEDTVEFVGLAEWTPQRIRDGLARGDAPVHYCAAALIGSLGMAEASVCHYQREDGGLYILVAVVEPAHRARVVHRPAPAGRAALRPELRPIADLLQKSDFGTQRGIRTYVAARRDGFDAAAATVPADERGAARTVWSAFAQWSGEARFAQAVWIAGRDPLAANRAAASAVLANFADRDLTWWTLVDGLRDADQGVRTVCWQTLISLTRGAPRRVDWSPAVASLRHVLAGTNLFAFGTVMEMLVATGVAPECAGPLLADNADLVLGHLGVSHAPVRDAARRFLSRLRGADLGAAPGPWKAWVATLERP